MTRKPIFEGKLKELRANVPINVHLKLQRVKLYTKSFSTPEALVKAIDIAVEYLEKKEEENRPDILKVHR